MSANETARTWFRQNPPITGRFKWSLRNNNNYEMTGLLVSLSYASTNRVQLLRNFYEKSKRSIDKAHSEGPVRRAPTPTTETRKCPEGSYIVRMDQLYSRIADALLDYQFWSPNDPQKNPYDDTGWTFPEGFATAAVRVVNTTVLRAPMTRVTGTVTAPGGVSGTGAVYVIDHNADNALATLRKLAASRPSPLAAHPLCKRTRSARRAWRSCTVGRAHKPRAGGDLALTQSKVPYDYISFQDLAKNAKLNATYDVLIMGPGSGDGFASIQGMPQWRNPIPWKNSPETPNIGTWAHTEDMRPGLGWDGLAHVQTCVQRGGVLITVDNTADFAIQYGLTNGVSSATPTTKVAVGTLLRTRLIEDASPIVYGIADNMAVFSHDGISSGGAASDRTWHG